MCAVPSAQGLQYRPHTFAASSANFGKDEFLLLWLDSGFGSLSKEIVSREGRVGRGGLPERGPLLGRVRLHPRDTLHTFCPRSLVHFHIAICCVK